MLEHASRSRHIDPDRPPAAAGGLRSQVPDLVHGPRELLDCRQLQQAGRRERTRSFDRRSKAGIDLAASAITLGRQSHVRRCPADDQRRSGWNRFLCGRPHRVQAHASDSRSRIPAVCCIQLGTLPRRSAGGMIAARRSRGATARLMGTRAGVEAVRGGASSAGGGDHDRGEASGGGASAAEG